MIEPLELTFDVACSVRHAFEVWTAKIDAWWPESHSFTGEPGLSVVLEQRLGGRIYERTTDGVERDWGEITIWEPPARFGYLWHLMSQRERATDVEIRFVEVDERSTRVEITHTGWERLGEGGQDWRDQNFGGWSDVLPHFIAAAEAS